MARRRVCRSLHLLVPLAVVLAGCTGMVARSPTTVPVADTSTTPTPPRTATTSTSTTSTSTTTTTTTVVAELPEIDAEVLVPDGAPPHPVVVLVHGGGWVGGSPAAIRGLATHLTAEGFLTVNTRYKLSNDSPGFPTAVDDVACAVRYAAAHPDGDGTVAVVGHSAGAHLGALVALTGDRYAEDCPVAGTGVPNRFVGLAGPYDVSRLGFLMLPFFGAGPSEAAESWLAGNPQRLVDQNPALVSLIMHGNMDGFVDPRFSVDFHRALEEAGSQTHLEVIPGARHLDLASPATVGELIVTWLER